MWKASERGNHLPPSTKRLILSEELFHFNGIPRYVLLDRDGKLLDENFPMYNIELFLKESKIRKE